MKSIMIGIPSVRERSDFRLSMKKFLPELSKKYHIEVIEVKNRTIPDARQMIADFFICKDFDYLLFLDDDHSNHTVDMVDALVNADTYVCAIKCYSRYFPHSPCLMDYSGINMTDAKYSPKFNKSGYDLCDVVGFGMTLIRKDTFNKLSRPFFVGENNQKEDNYFCDKLQEIGIKPVGCFNYTLTHDGIDETNIDSLTKEAQDYIINDLRRQMPDYNFNHVVFIG